MGESKWWRSPLHRVFQESLLLVLWLSLLHLSGGRAVGLLVVQKRITSIFVELTVIFIARSSAG